MKKYYILVGDIAEHQLHRIHHRLGTSQKLSSLPIQMYFDVHNNNNSDENILKDIVEYEKFTLELNDSLPNNFIENIDVNGTYFIIAELSLFTSVQRFQSIVDFFSIHGIKHHLTLVLPTITIRNKNKNQIIDAILQRNHSTKISILDVHELSLPYRSLVFSQAMNYVNDDLSDAILRQIA